MLRAGHASRLELYGSLLLVVIVVSLICERLAIDRVLIDKLIKDRNRPAVVQENNNHQETTVVVESDRMKDIIERVKKTGQNDVNGTNSTANKSGQSGVPATSNAVTGSN